GGRLVARSGMNKLGLVFAITIGALVLNCTSTHHGNGNGDGGMLGDAHADPGACCTLTPQTFTTLAQGDFTLSSNTTLITAPVDVSQYREVVVGYQITSGNCYINSSSIGFKEPGTEVFITQQPSGRIRVDGPIAQGWFFTAFVAAGCSGTAHWVYAGVNLN